MSNCISQRPEKAAIRRRNHDLLFYCNRTKICFSITAYIGSRPNIIVVVYCVRIFFRLKKLEIAQKHTSFRYLDNDSDLDCDCDFYVENCFLQFHSGFSRSKRKICVFETHNLSTCLQNLSKTLSITRNCRILKFVSVTIIFEEF